MPAHDLQATKTQRHEVTVRWKRYRVFVNTDGAVVRIDSINPTMGEKVTYKRVSMTGVVAAAVKAKLGAEAPV